MATKKIFPKPVKGQVWIRKRDQYVVDIESVTPTKITICQRAELLIYDYKPETFQRNFRWPRVPIRPGELFEPERQV